MAKGVIVRIIAITCSNHRAFTAYLLEEDGCHCHCQRGLLGAATIVEEELELAITFVEEELELAAIIIDQRTSGAAMDAYKERHMLESKMRELREGK